MLLFIKEQYFETQRLLLEKFINSNKASNALDTFSFLRADVSIYINELCE